MHDITKLAVENSFWITITALLVFIAYIKGGNVEMKRQQKFLDEQLDWLRDRNDDWLRLFGDVGEALTESRAAQESDNE